jgi:protease-4
VKARKPLVVSMGNVAGSGGYYVSCGADTIFADDSTITGSIGVVSGKFVTNPMWDKVGITFKAYQRGENAALLNSARPFTEAERKRLQSWMDEVYDRFKGHVIAIRGAKLKKPIDQIAGGRVYTGKQALELGLVDRIGSLSDAIAFVAGEAKLKEGAYEVRVVPEPKNFLEVLMSPDGAKDEDARKIIGLPRSGDSLVELALPHLRGMDPRRVEAVKGVLRRLEMMQARGVMMLMIDGVPMN